MFATLGQCYKTVYKGYLLPFYGISCDNNTGWQQYHGMAVNYHGKKFYNIGPRCLFHKHFKFVTYCRTKISYTVQSICTYSHCF